MLYVVVLCGYRGGGLVVNLQRAAQIILIVGSDGGSGNGIQVLTIGREPYNGMQRAYGSSVTSTWG